MTLHHPVNLVKSRNLFHILRAVLYFTVQLFLVFHRLFYRIANLGGIDLKFSGSIHDVNIDYPTKFREVGIKMALMFFLFFA